jgi:hypothetical protein
MCLRYAARQAQHNEQYQPPPASPDHDVSPPIMRFPETGEGFGSGRTNPSRTNFTVRTRAEACADAHL